MILDDESKSSNPESSNQNQKLHKIKSNTNQKSKVERDSSRTLSSENASGSGSEPGSNYVNEGEDSSKAGSQKTQVGVEVRITKKRRTDMVGTAVTTATTLTVQPEKTGAVSTGRIKGINAKPGRQINDRFQRVDPNKIESIMDNRYVAKV